MVVVANEVYSEEERTIPPVNLERLDDFGASLAKTRSEAISARKASGIEEIWREDEEFYEGVDALNRSESHSTWGQKPPGQTEAQKNTTRSTVFPNITGPFCDSAAARMADMLLPTDDRGWAFQPTPVPDLINLSNGKITDRLRQEIAGGLVFKNDETIASAEEKAINEAQQALSHAKEKAEDAQKIIEDWHTESQYHAQVRLVIEDAARIGTGILKGPIPQMRKSVAWINGQTVVKEKLKPISKWVSPWNFYPDAACGENIHNGSYTWERDHLAKKQLRRLADQPGYIEEQIARCLEEGPHEAIDKVVDPSALDQNSQNSKNKFEVWYMYGVAEKEDIEAAGCDCEDEEGVGKYFPVMITMVNNHVIKVDLNPLDEDEFPYDVMIWRRRSGHWTGIGVARQIRSAQKIVVGATRNLMDNAGIAAGPMLIMKQGAVVPSDGRAGFAARKVYYIGPDHDDIDDVRKAIGTIKVDMMVNELMSIVEFGIKLAESNSSMPMLLQGQMGQSSPDTLGGQQLFQNNASTVLRRLTRLFDDRITEPHIRRYYLWLLKNEEGDEGKGDFVIDARGSSALVEREIQKNEIVQIGNLVIDPRFGIDPKKWMDEYLKSRRFDTKRFYFDDEEWKSVIESMSQPPQDSRVEVEQLRGAVQEKLAQYKADFESQENERDRQFEAEKIQQQQEFSVFLKELDGELETLKQQGAKEISIDRMNDELNKIKGKLAQESMRINAQVKLSGSGKPAPQVAEPAAEPPGRAAPGYAYQQ